MGYLNKCIEEMYYLDSKLARDTNNRLLLLLSRVCYLRDYLS
jgi:hypothetical protein